MAIYQDKIHISKSCGARRGRTADIQLAKLALYQLSYGPKTFVGPGRFELPTSRLSGVRSHQLSYEPKNRATREHKILKNNRALSKLNSETDHINEALTGISTTTRKLS